MSLSDQFKQVKINTDSTIHTFLNGILNGVRNKIERQISDMKLQATGKVINGSIVQVKLVGSVVADDANHLQEIDDKVRQIISELKNPSDLMSGFDVRT